MDTVDKFKASPEQPVQHVSLQFLQHAQAPENIGTLEGTNGQATGVGTCGDSVQVFVKVNDNRIEDIRYLPNGCLHTLVCASALSKLAKGHTLKQALKLGPQDVVDELGGLPEDHLHCARLAVNTLGEALDDYFQNKWRFKLP